MRIGPDGFMLRETVAEYIQILTLNANELQKSSASSRRRLSPLRRVRIFGGGALIFDEYGQLKYQIANGWRTSKHQQVRLDYLAR